MQPSQGGAGKVLIVEDDPAILELLSIRLDLAGYRTAQAKDGHAALETWNSLRPDLVILDVNMPLLSGFGVLEVRRDQGLHGRTPVLMLTARNTRADVLQAKALGVHDYMSKPFDERELLQRVAKLVKSHRAKMVSATGASVLW